MAAFGRLCENLTRDDDPEKRYRISTEVTEKNPRESVVSFLHMVQIIYSIIKTNVACVASKKIPYASLQKCSQVSMKKTARC